mgnify:CR=1 FL=1
MLHLDVKPGNVLVLPDLSVSLLDFNLASTDGDDVRLAGGTLPYMASEQLLNLLDSMQETCHANDASARAQHESAEATDVFGLCATLWHLVSGEPPFGVTVDIESRREAAETMLERQKNGVDTEQISRVAAVLPPAAVELLLAGLSFERHRRPAAASDLSDMLTGVLPVVNSISQASKPNVAESRETAEAVSRRNVHRRGWAGAAAVILILATTLTMALLWNDIATPGTDTVDAGGMGTPSAPAQKIHEAVFFNALTLIDAEKFDEAIDIVNPYLDVSQDCRLVDLYCRTCRLPALTPKMAGPLLTPETQEANARWTQLNTSWNAVLAEWEQLATSRVFPATTCLNIAYIHLEFSDFKAAKLAFQQALAFGLRESAGARMQLIVQLTDRQERNEFPNDTWHKWLNQLEHNATNDGSRGEFLALLTAYAKELSEFANVESAEPNVEVEKLNEELTKLFRRIKHLAGEGSCAEVLLKCRALVHTEFHSEIVKSAHKTESPPPHRLHRVLLFPGQDG